MKVLVWILLIVFALLTACGKPETPFEDIDEPWKPPFPVIELPDSVAISRL